jgi:hypothetical protein
MHRLFIRERMVESGSVGIHERVSIRGYLFQNSGVAEVPSSNQGYPENTCNCFMSVVKHPA